MRRKETQIVGFDRQRELDRRGKAAVERRDRPLRYAGEDECLARLRQFQHAALERALSALRAARGSGALSAESLPTAVELYRDVVVMLARVQVPGLHRAADPKIERQADHRHARRHLADGVVG